MVCDLYTDIYEAIKDAENSRIEADWSGDERKASFSDNPTDYEKEIIEDTIDLIIKKLKQLEAQDGA